MDPHESDDSYALLVDPDAETGNAVREALEETSLELREVKTIAEAFLRLGEAEPRLVLSELSLPDGSGFALCRRLRESAKLRELPVILISHWKEEGDRILAFESGADDFLPKPFFRRELSSRIKAILRRSERASLVDETADETTGSNPLVIDEERREVRFEGDRILLTPREFSLLATLARHEGRVLSRTDLIAEAWSPGERPTERSVDAHVKSLRRKLGAAKDLIETVRGLGYRFAERALTGATARPATGRGAAAGSTAGP